MKTNKQHKEIVDRITKEYEAEIKYLRLELEQARNLKAILEKLYPIASSNEFRFNDISGELILPDRFAEYVEDLCGGKVIKQEANKVIKISKEGIVRVGMTKQKVDKGYSYKLIRE
jgi:hypothetical protein